MIWSRMYFSLRRQHTQKLRWMASLFLCFLCWFPLSSSAKAAALPDFRDVFKQQNVVMLVIDPQSGQIIDANPAAIEFYGYTKPECIFSKSISFLKSKLLSKGNWLRPRGVTTLSSVISLKAARCVRLKFIPSPIRSTARVTCYP